MYYTYKVAAILIRPINGGTDSYTVADVQMSFTKDWHPDDPETDRRITEIVNHAFCGVGEVGDYSVINPIAIKLAEEFIS